MEKDKLVELVIEEVLKHFQNYKIEEKNKMVAVNFSKEDIKILEEKYSDEYKIEYPFKIYKGIEADIVFIGEIDFDDLSLMAQGRNTSFGHIMELIMLGKKIVIPRSALTYLQYEKTCPKSLFALYRSYEKYLSKMGVIFLNDLYDSIEDQKITTKTEVVTKSESVVIDKKVIRESDVLDSNISSGEIKVLQNSIITPLAMDAIKDNKLTLLRV